ncbi:MAG TPA: peptidoglycan DD-metalloendopeptidase family protein [Pyrinomonadaceae bacterium]
MDIPQLTTPATTTPAETGRPAKDEAAVRQMAMEFESLLLNQLTSTLNKTDDEDGNGLFSDSGGGLSMSRQLFSEQLSKTLSQSGGIGLADLIMSQVAQNKSATKPNQASPLSAMRELRNSESVSSRGSGRIDQGITNADSAAPAPTESTGRFITSEAALATRPRRVHPVRTEVVRPTTEVSEGPRSVVSVAKAPEIHRSSFVSLRLPFRGAIRSVFGPRRDPINGRPRFHKGIDIAAPFGAPIQAAAAGRVVFAGPNKGYGNMVMIEHADGRRTLYAHAEALYVKVGATVAAGQTIAAVGSTGHSTGPHVHFEIRVGDQAVNPLTNMINDFVASRR